MSSDWDAKRLGDLCELRAGSAFPQRYQGKRVGEYPFIKVSDLSDSGNGLFIRGAPNWVDEDERLALKAKPFPRGAVVFAKIGEGLKRNRRRLLLQPTLLDNNLMGAIPRAAVIEPRFLHHAMSQIDLGEVAGGSALPYLTARDLGEIVIAVPPLAEQRRIAGVLGALDDKIEHNLLLRGRCQELAGSFFDEFFRGESGRHPLAEIVDVHKTSLVPARTPDQVFEHYSIPAFDAAEVPAREHGAAILSSKTLLPSGISLLASKLNPATPRIWWVHPSKAETAVCSSEFIVLRSTGEYPASFIYASLRHDNALYDEILSHVTGTTGSRQRVKPADVLACSVLKPPSDQVARFDSVARPLYERAMRALGESLRLGAIRDALLPKLVSGRIRVPESYDPDDVLGTVVEQAAAS
jgi:type I restriction enzyme S subunit